MDIVVGLGHPAHVHFYRNPINELETRGHEVHVVTKKRPLAIDLLNAYNIEHEVAGRWRIQHHNRLKTGLSFFSFEFDVINAVGKYNPDVVTGIGNIPLAHASSIFDCTSVIFTDTEHASFANSITFPFADYIYTPEFCRSDIGPKHRKYPSYHELAYLHPTRFTPDPNVLDKIGLNEDDRFVILRTVDWNAIHDVGDSGIDCIHDIVEGFERRGTNVLITAEGEIPEPLTDRRISIESHRIHNLMYYADLYIGESATMATESAVLGTPAIYISTYECGNTNELDEQYGLVFNYHNDERQQDAFERAISILEDYSTEEWERRRKRMLEDRIDLTPFIVDKLLTIDGDRTDGNSSGE